VEVNSTTKTL